MNMLSNVMLLLAIVAFVNAESILMTEVFIIPIKPETFDWNDDGKKERYYLITNNDIEKDLHRVHMALTSRKRYTITCGSCETYGHTEIT